MANKRIIILGAGLTGLSAAWHLQRRGRDCLVFEKEPQIGGLCRSKRVNGFTFDYDGHLLHFKSHYAFRLIRKLLGNNLLEHKRNAWVYSHSRYTLYPFQANLYGLPSKVIQECFLGFVQTLNNGKVRNKKNLNFLGWINQNFGTGIAQHFMVPYNTKFWTLPPQELTCAWLDGFIPVPSLTQVIRGTVEENKGELGYNARFWYPKKGGIQEVPLALSAQIKNIYTNCEAIQIDIDKKIIKTISGGKERFDYLVSTVSLPELAYIIKGLPEYVTSLFKRLKWNSIFNLNLGIERKDNSNRHWIYFPQKQICFFRTGFFHNFSSDTVPAGKSSLYIEVSYSKNKPIDRKNIISHIQGDLEKVGILTKNDKISAKDINDIKYGYPIYDAHYNEARNGILRYLLGRDIISCGRYGSWRYLSMEGALLDGKNIATNI
jgi:protoporphyrinogen oxidase